MRRILILTVGLLLVALAVTILALVQLTKRALEAAERGPAQLCLSESHATRWAAGTLPMSRKDMLVETSANFASGARRGLRWQLRGEAISVAYRTFWSERQRSAVFERLANKMNRCPPRAD